MFRGIVILAAVIGTAFLTSAFIPSMRHVAFNVSTWGITWVMLASLAMGVCAYKVTK